VAKKEDIDFISYGLIDRNKLKPIQTTSLNVWFSILDKTISNYTNKKIDFYSLLNMDFTVIFPFLKNNIKNFLKELFESKYEIY